MKVLITTSGVGSKLGYLTKFMNKAMIKLGKKPVISYIIEQYPKDYEFIISLGYFGDHIKQFLPLCYPDRKFTFVNVDNYDGPGSSQAYSMLCCKDYLQEPFIYNDCDTIIDEHIENFNEDFICGYPTDKIRYHSNYDAYNTKSKGYIETVSEMFSKGESTYPKYTYVGICGIYDYEYFWNSLISGLENNIVSSDFDVFANYYKNRKLIHKTVDNWKDTGNVDNILHYRKEFEDNLNILDKNDQSIFIFDKFVIKFFTNDSTVNNIINRHYQLGKLTHEITENTRNFFKYDFIEGDTVIHCMNPVRFKEMMSYFEKNNLWEEKSFKDSEKFEEYKNSFYINKTIDRINKFKEEYNVNEDDDIYINDVLIPQEYTIEYMLNILKNQPEYINSKPTSWHGDFTLENIIYDNNKGKYTLIDCRDKFGSTIYYGDKLYDYGKMNHNFTFNFDNAILGNYKLNIEDNYILFSILVDSEVYKCREVLKDIVESQNIRYDYIEALSGLCWLNMSPLHKIDNMPLLLFYMGKLKLYESIKKLENNK